MVSPEEFVKMLKDHDWTYMYSDDPRYYRKGLDEWTAITRAITTNPHLKSLYEAYKETHDI